MSHYGIRAQFAGGRQKQARWLERVLYFLASILLGRSIVEQNAPNFPLDLYAKGLGPMPFQTRYLMSPVMRWAAGSHQLVQATAQLHNSARTSQELLLQIVNVICILILGWLTPQIRKYFQPPSLLPWLSRWLLLWILTMTLAVREEQAIFVPYDLPAILFFTLGMFFCLRKQLIPFIAVVAVGMYNRETMLFLAVIWAACTFRKSISLAAAGALLTLVLWRVAHVEIVRWLGRSFSGMQAALRVNVRMLEPHHLPQVLSAGGFLIIPVIFFWRKLRDKDLRLLWFSVLPFLGTALWYGWWNETRIFGEISVLVACSASLLLDQFILDISTAGATRELHA